MYKRSLYQIILDRLLQSRTLIQIMAGPRQVGKTTLAGQIEQAMAFPVHYASADGPALRGSSWIEQQWHSCLLKIQTAEKESGLLILDEVQKIPHWSETVKRLWDENQRRGDIELKLIILGSSTLLIRQGAMESLAGRFELIHVPHWSFKECKEAFGWNVDKYIYFGWYPGATPFIADHQRWTQYVLDSLVETTISRDIMLMSNIHKPALLRQLFELGCLYSGQILSYQKMLGQLQEAGNASTLAHYLDLLSRAGMLTGLSKFTEAPVRLKASSPKLQVLNMALITSQMLRSFEELRGDCEAWGRLTESAVGAHLVNSARGTNIEVLYWREGNKEVDFILKKGNKVTAIEVKSGKKPTSLPGIDAFAKQFCPSKILLVGSGGMSLEEFLLGNIENYI